MKWQTFVAWILIFVIGGILSYFLIEELKKKQSA